MTGTHPFARLRNPAALALIALHLSACLMGEEESNLDGDTLTDHRISGSVGDGPISGATIRILERDGAELAQLQSDTSAGYNITVRTYADQYPLSLEASGGTDLVTNAAPVFTLRSAVPNRGADTVANLNPFSTFAFELAGELPGGVDAANLAIAESAVTAEFNNGLTTLADASPMSSRIDSSNVAELVRASEALGETVRRARDALGTSGFASSGDAIVGALSSDLTDNVVDGLGGARSDARIAAVTTLVSAQVLLETMANELHINGADAMQAMTNAINQVSTDAPNPGLDELTVTREMLERARIGLVAAHAVTSDAAIADLLSGLEGVREGASASTVRMFALPVDYRNRLDNAVVLVAGGSAAVHETVNDISRNRTQSISVDNRAPTIAGTPAASVEVGQPYSFTPQATDPDGDTLTFNIANLPSWASFDTATGTLSGTPGANDVGTYSGISIDVSDGEFTVSLAAFSIEVFNDNVAPQISGTPPGRVTVGTPYDFTPTASDANGDTLTFSVNNRPTWLVFDAATGRLSGTPSDIDIGIHGDIAITVSDGALTAMLGPFSIEVEAVVVNSPPVIGGTPTAAVTEGSAYSFTPTASDPDGDNLVFSVVGLPGWASFDTSTGRIAGTPQSGDVGTYAGITITVSDGMASADLGPFTITVEPISLGSVTLSWTAPTQNEDGTPLTDLDGYRIYWGTTPGVYPNSVTIDNESVTTYVIDNLAPGTYEFVATSFNTSGVESAYSVPATKVVP